MSRSSEILCTTSRNSSPTGWERGARACRTRCRRGRRACSSLFVQPVRRQRAGGVGVIVSLSDALSGARLLHGPPFVAIRLVEPSRPRVEHHPSRDAPESNGRHSGSPGWPGLPVRANDTHAPLISTREEIAWPAGAVHELHGVNVIEDERQLHRCASLAACRCAPAMAS